MVAVADARRRVSLLHGRNMQCPRCRTFHDVLRYQPMEQIDEFKEETYPIYKCPSCRWRFSPAPTIEEQIRIAVDLLREHRPWLLMETR